jgi:O-antigen ligase
MTPTDPGERQETHRIVLVVILLASAVAAAFLAESALIAIAILGIAALVALSQSVQVLKGAFVALVLLELPLQADIYLARDEAVAETAALSGYVFSLTTAALALLLLVWLAERAAGHGDLVPASQISISSWTYLGWVGLSTLWALDPTRALQEFWVMAQAVLLFAYLRNHLDSGAGVARVRFLLILALLTQGLIVVATEVFGPLTIGPIESTLAGARAAGTVGSPNVLGSFVTMLLPLAIVGLRRDMQPMTKAVAWAAAGAGAVSLILSSSRGAWVGSALAVGIIVVIGLVRGWFGRPTIAAAGLGTLAAVAVFGSQIVARVSAFDNEAAQARGPLNRLALQIIGESPWFGVGANNFSAASPDFLDISFAGAWISTVHNKYLLVWAETGIVGLLLFLWFFWSVLSAASRLSGRGAQFAPEALAVLAAFIGTAAHMLVDIFHGRVQYELLWLLAALLEGIRVVRGRDPSRAGRVVSEA